jgi:hypothetical protein
MYVFFKTTLTDFERPVNTSLEDSIHMPQNYNNPTRRQAPNSRDYSPPANASSETPAPQTWENAISAYGWDVPRNVRRGRNRPTSTLDDVVGREYPRKDGALKLERENQTELERKLRREEAPARFDCRGDRSAAAVSASQIQRSGPVHQVPLAASRGGRSHAFNIPRETHSPILQRVRNIHVNGRDEMFTAVSKIMGDTESKQARVDDASDDEELIKPQIKKIEARKSEIAKSSPPPTPGSITAMKADMSDSNWVKPLYASANPPQCVLTEKEATKECDGIAKGTGEMWMSKNLKASSRELLGYKAVKPPENPRSVHAEIIRSNRSISSESSEEDDSVHYSLEDDFERLETPTNSDSEHNGARRKWYKGYRR